MEYAILVLLVILSGFLALIYKKLDTRKDDQECHHGQVQAKSPYRSKDLGQALLLYQRSGCS